MAVAAFVGTRFFVSHYIFRWRTAMNDYYMANWPQLRHIEGASQRVQEDTMRFAQTIEGLGVSMVDAVMTLIAFLPILLRPVRRHVTELPIVGEIPYPLVYRRDRLVAVRHGAARRRRHQAARAWSSATSASRRPTARNWSMARTTRTARSRPPCASSSPMSAGTISGSISTTSISTWCATFYLQADNIFAYLILVPTIAAGKITFGILQQITDRLHARSVRRSSIWSTSWPTIVELLSIHKRLRAFEAMLHGERAAGDRPPLSGAARREV